LRESTIGVRFRRRGLTVPGILLGLPCLLVLLAPVLLVGGLTDLVFRRRGSTVRVSLYAVWLFAVESVGIVRAGLLWLRYAPSGQLGGGRPRCRPTADSCVGGRPTWFEARALSWG